ncbi:MAG: hypothetical protein HND44_16815 [Chloroflexi bacterium]|nr:hypothetical protein [Ardenticatenaceae bacterium]MBL1130120.1 hypothetical protein [Chloroflexota bacterium]NOG36207.1 hypothetical protein [Chloroflexota bacterium]GIK56261.1 MAG: hypothetical protein BroJett015_19240 [Chloroflexota bacterium]
MGELARLIFILAISAICVVALLSLLPFLLPRRVARARHAIQSAPGRAFLIGLANALFFLVIAAILLQGGEGGGLLAMFIVLTLLALAAIGLAGLVTLLRDRIYPHAADTPGMSLTVRTAVLLTLASLLPFLGWFLISPLLLLLTLGAALTTFVWQEGNKAKQSPGDEMSGTEEIR